MIVVEIKKERKPTRGDANEKHRADELEGTRLFYVLAAHQRKGGENEVYMI